MKAFEEFEPSYLKALFAQLVQAVRTQEAAAAYLGVSRQRVGALISAAEEHAADVPTWAQVWKLEQVVGTSLVFGALARAVEGEQAADPMATAIECSVSAAASLQSVADMVRDGRLTDGELKDARAKAREALDDAKAHFDSLMSMKPTLRAVAS